MFIIKFHNVPELFHNREVRTVRTEQLWKEWLKSVVNYRSYPKSKTGYPVFLDHPVVALCGQSSMVNAVSAKLVCYKLKIAKS